MKKQIKEDRKLLYGKVYGGITQQLRIQSASKLFADIASEACSPTKANPISIEAAQKGRYFRAKKYSHAVGAANFPPLQTHNAQSPNYQAGPTKNVDGKFSKRFTSQSELSMYSFDITGNKKQEKTQTDKPTPHSVKKTAKKQSESMHSEHCHRRYISAIK